MIRSALILTMSFAVGFALCLVVRAGLHHPYAAGPATASAPMPMAPPEHEGGHDQGAGASASGTAAAAAPRAAAPATPTATATASPSPEHAAAPARSASSSRRSACSHLGVATTMANSVCPVCGAGRRCLAADFDLPCGRIIGFGCAGWRAAKEKFDADPERPGPAALANRKAE